MKGLRGLVVVLLLSFVAVAYVLGTTATGAEGAGIETGDHGALAKYYHRQASEARQSAAVHRMMAESYRKQGGGLVEKAHLDEHCDKLAASFEAQAKMYEEMATAHRGMGGKK